MFNNDLQNDILSIENLDYFIPKATNRYLHIMGVIDLAYAIENIISFDGNLVTASLYHDIGYSNKIKITGFHPIDSALKARKDGIESQIIDAVILHTGAKGEASFLNKSLLDYYSSVSEDTELSKFLTYCDTHINSKGKKVSLDERLDDIYSRYDINHYIYKNIKNYENHFREIENYVEKMLKGKL